MINRDDLRDKAWYYGFGSHGMVALWNKDHFLSINPNNNQLESLLYFKEFLPLYIIDSAFTKETIALVDKAFNSINK